MSSCHTDQGCSEWLDILFISDDANFRMKRLNVSSLLRDPCLNKGFSYFVEEEAFACHLAHHEESMPEEGNTCNNHDAIKLVTMHGGKEMATSGIGGVVCAHHEF